MIMQGYILSKSAGKDYEALPHPPYSLNLAPSDYHLSDHYFEGRQFIHCEEIKILSVA